MRKIIISFLVILMVAVIGITVFFVKTVYYVKSDDSLIKEETTETTNEETTKILENGKILKIEDGMKVEYESDGKLYAITAPEDSTKYSMLNKSRVFILTDALVGHYSILEMPISNHFKETHITDRTKLFPGLVMTEYYHDPSCKNITDDSFTVIVRANKFQDIEYTFKYALNDKDELDSIEYISQEVVKDYTKEVEKRERIYLMLKNGDDIHEDDEYLKVLKAVTYSFEDLGTMDHLGVIDDLKEKIRAGTFFPISNERGYYSFIRKEYANYDLKKVTIFAGSFYKKEFAKYQIDFDYNNEYYLTKFNIIGEVPITEEEFRLELKQPDIVI